MRTHRVGTITLGITLIVCGIIFLLQFFIPAITFSVICRMWPLIFIVLGVEILISNWKDKEGVFIYDKGSIFLTFMITAFAMILGLISEAMIIAERNMHITF